MWANRASSTCSATTKGLAKTSATPGKTLLINHFIINNRMVLGGSSRIRFRQTLEVGQKKLDQMISSYILQRQQLVNTFVLIDIRHDPMKIDTDFINWLGESSIPFAIIFTKADKLGPVKAKQNAAAWMKALKEQWEELPPTS